MRFTGIAAGKPLGIDLRALRIRRARRSEAFQVVARASLLNVAALFQPPPPEPLPRRRKPDAKRRRVLLNFFLRFRAVKRERPRSQGRRGRAPPDMGRRVIRRLARDMAYLGKVFAVTTIHVIARFFGRRHYRARTRSAFRVGQPVRNPNFARHTSRRRPRL